MTLNALVKELVSSSEIGRRHDVDIGEVLQKICKEVEDSLEENIQMPMEALHISAFLGKPISPIATVNRLDKDQQELTIEWLMPLS